MIKELDEKYVAHTYKRFPVEIVSGKGSLCYDAEGREYIDLGAGIGVTAFGICDSEWINAVKSQLEKLQHMSNLYYTEPCALLAKELCDRTGMSRVFFGNSGAEANECAIKVIRKYAQDKKGSDWNTIITLKNSFHGRTLATLSATGQDAFHKLFTPLVPGFTYVEAGNFDEFKTAAKENKCAGVLIECVQGEGGVVCVDPDFIKKVYDYCAENDLVFAVDEVQTGNGRTGELYSYMHFGVKPDVVTTAKGLGGGLPIGACILSDKVKDVLGYGEHGSTFGGNPVCAAGALNILKRIDDPLLDEVNKKSRLVFEKLRAAKGVSEVSGLGLMIGIKTEKDAASLANSLIDKGVLVLTAKDKIRLLPALNIPEELLLNAIDIILKECGE